MGEEAADGHILIHEYMLAFHHARSEHVFLSQGLAFFTQRTSSHSAHSSHSARTAWKAAQPRHAWRAGCVKRAVARRAIRSDPFSRSGIGDGLSLMARSCATAQTALARRINLCNYKPRACRLQTLLSCRESVQPPPKQTPQNPNDNLSVSSRKRKQVLGPRKGDILPKKRA